MTPPHEPGSDPGPPQPASKAPEGRHWVLTFTQVFPHPPEAVWAALTDPAQLTIWAPYTADRRLDRVGPAKLRLNGVESVTEHNGEVTLAQAPVRLEHARGEDRLRWSLAPVDTGTRLTLEHTVAEEGALPTTAAGWHLCLLVAERLLDGTPIEPIVGPRARDFGFESLRDAYGTLLDPPSP